MIRSTLCDYSDAYILVKGTTTVENTATAAAPNKRNKNVMFKSCALATDWISEINSKQIDHAKENDAVMSMYNVIEYRI